MKTFFSRIRDKIKSLCKRIKIVLSAKTARAEAFIQLKYNKYKARYDALDKRRQNRVLVLTLSSIFLADYLMICFLVGRNPINIFPSIPVLDMRDEITVYLPSPDTVEPLKETRKVQKNDDKIEYIKRLTRFVIEGSYFENTRAMTPIDGNVRNVWIYEGTCVVDMRLDTLDPEAPLVAGSEIKFREALKKTIIANIKGVTNVIVLENGIPEKDIWESAAADKEWRKNQDDQDPSNTSTAGPDIDR
jgi:hypothetical protein